MTKPSQFIYTSDYSSIWSSPQKTLSVTIPASIVIPAQSSSTYFTDLVIPSGAYLAWSKIVSSIDPTVTNINRYLLRTYSVGSFRTASVYTYVYQPSPVLLRIMTVVSNNNPLGPGTITTSATVETITASVRLMSVPQ